MRGMWGFTICGSSAEAPPQNLKSQFATSSLHILPLSIGTWSRLLFLFQEEPMVLLMGKVFFQKVCDPVMNLSDLLVGEAVP